MRGRITGVLTDTGDTMSIALEGVRKSWQVRRWGAEFVVQAVFLVKVTLLPVILIALPLGATISLQIGQLTRQLGGESFTGAAVIVGVIREAAPIAAALLIAGAGGSAMTADMGARNIRDELAAMEVMAVNPVGRLVTPRLWAASARGHPARLHGHRRRHRRRLRVQRDPPGGVALVPSSTAPPPSSGCPISSWPSARPGCSASSPPPWPASAGMSCDRSPVGVGLAVKQAVVVTFLAVFSVNYVITSLYVLLVPQRVF